MRNYENDWRKRLEETYRAPRKEGDEALRTRTLAIWMRTLAIWVFGLLASAIIGGLLASRLASGDPSSPLGDPFGVGLYFGVPAGMLSFACIRLWLAGPGPKNPK
jgi:hypothetical protein